MHMDPCQVRPPSIGTHTKFIASGRWWAIENPWPITAHDLKSITRFTSHPHARVVLWLSIPLAESSRSRAKYTNTCNWKQNIWECQAVLYWTMLTSRSFRFFLSSFALPFPFPTVRTPRQLVPFPSIHTTPPRFSNSSTVRRRPYRRRTQLRTPVFRALPSGLNIRAVSRLRSVSSSLRGLNDACAGRRLVDLCF